MSIFQKISEYIFYLCQCRSEHYVHSPYVYRLMRECIKPRRMFGVQGEDEFFERVKVFLGTSDIIRIGTDEELKMPPTDCVVFVDRPFANAQRAEAWREIVADDDVRLTIDVYYAGLILPSKAEEKEHFCLNFF